MAKCKNCKRLAKDKKYLLDFVLAHTHLYTSCPDGYDVMECVIDVTCQQCWENWFKKTFGDEEED